MWKNLVRIGLIILSVLATVKICLLGLGIDEEYAVTMSYRIAAGDQLFQELWEPHQTSGFLTSFLIRIFLLLTGSLDHLILYLRIAGSIIQFAISLFLYNTLKKCFSRDVCFVVAVFFYNTLPKWIQTPEFTNMLVWFSVLTFLCFMRYYCSSDHRNPFWLVAAGISASCLVLSYPSCILVVPVTLFCMWMIQREEKMGISAYCRQAALFLAACAVCGGVYMISLLRKMSFGDFLYGVSQMTVDGAHSATFVQKIWNYGQESAALMVYVFLGIFPALLLCLCVRKWRAYNIFILLSVSAALIEQMVIWLGNSAYMQKPLVYFYLLYAGGVLTYHHYFKREKTNGAVYGFLFWMGIVQGGMIWLSALVITNTTISATGSYLMIGLISAILFIAESFSGHSDGLDKAVSRSPLLVGLAAIFLLGATLFAKGFLVYSNDGFKDTVAMVRQKALSGPAKGIYCRYMDGYALNCYAELMEQSAIEHANVLYVGTNSLYYLYGEQIVCNYSTISTPTYDERLLEYWERNPDRWPELVICDTSESVLDDIRRILPLGDLLAERPLSGSSWGIRIYKVLAP